MKIIDLEAHCYTPSLIQLLSQRQTYPRYDPEHFHIQFREGYFVRNKTIMEQLTDDLEARIAHMDRYGIQAQVLSLSPGIELLPPVESVEMAKQANNFLYAASQQYPGRFYAFAALPVGNLPAAEAELKRCMGELGFLGWNTFSNYGPTAPDEERYRPLWTLAAQLRAPVYLHPTDPYFGRFGGLGPQLSSAALGFGVDTCITLMRLIFSGVLDENPELKILLGHLGEALPFTLERMDNRCRLDQGPPAKNQYLPSHYFRNNIYVTTSGQSAQEAFRCTKAVLGMDRILFASDYPYEAPEEVQDFLQALELSQTDREKLLFRNAEALFGRSL